VAHGKSLYPLKLLAGSSNRPLAEEIASHLGVPLADLHVNKFSDGEINVEIGESVRGAEVFVVQSTSTPSNDHLMELLIVIDALKRASAAYVTAVIPYYGYARQDRKVAPRAPITAKLVADLLATAGAQRVVSMELHAGQIQGFFDVPVDHLYSSPVFVRYLTERYGRDGDLVIVSPDAGGVERARAYCKRLDAPLAIVDKRRTQPNVAEVMSVIGDVEGKTAVILDDMIDTAGTLTQAAKALLDRSARRVIAAATHAVLSGPALRRIAESAIEEVVVTNSIAPRADTKACGKIKILSVAPLFAEAIRRIHEGDSVSSLFG
jgi:ribose-phosphate pyrophosphokinase